MRLPWVSRKYLELANLCADRAREAQQEAESARNRANNQLDAFVEEASKRIAHAHIERDAAREEVKLLLDRIVQMSGQPAIFHPEPVQAPAPTPANIPSAIPAPETRVSFRDVHRAAQSAIRKGELNILSGRSN